MTTTMISFDEMSKQVWAATDIQEKKALLTKMVETFRYKGKGNAHVVNFKSEIAKCDSIRRLDQLAANLALNVTDKVVK